jgi:hypothetical protein
MATVTVQSLLNAATYDSYTVTLATDTVNDLKAQIIAADGVDATWFDLVLNERVLTGTDTLSAAGVVNNDRLRTANKIANLATKQARQEAKLELAALDRAAYGSRPQYYDITKLPNPYNGNDVDPNDGADTLEEGRPWSSTAPIPSFTNPTLTIGSAVSTVAQSPFAGGGNSYSFSSSVNSFIDTPASSDWAVGTGDFTIEWFSYQTTLSGFQRAFTVDDFASIDIGSSIESGTFYYWANDAFRYNSSSASTANTWIHWAIVRAGGITKVYRNGTQLGSQITDTNNITNTADQLTIGNENTASTIAAFVGYITNFRWIKGLAVYTGNFTVPTSALTATAAANPYGGSNTAAISSGVTKLLLVP